MTDQPTHSPDDAEESTALPMDDNLCAALALLWHAYDCAQDAHGVAWDFALEIGKLYEVGLTITDLRWLVVKGYVAHGAETSSYGDAHRSFTPSEGLNFVTTTCVVLTEKGAAFAGQVLQATAENNAADETHEKHPNTEPGRETPPRNGDAQPKANHKPHWHPERRVLSFGGRVVKRFLVPASNQETILSAFQEEGWPEHIDDPLPGNHGIDPKARLNDAIYRLNRKQLKLMIRFHTNGNGNGIHWSVVRTQNGAPASENGHETDPDPIGANQ
jgi:hypothetical protein